jgi:hypothetical protein
MNHLAVDKGATVGITPYFKTTSSIADLRRFSWSDCESIFARDSASTKDAEIVTADMIIPNYNYCEDPPKWNLEEDAKSLTDTLSSPCLTHSGVDWDSEEQETRSILETRLSESDNDQIRMEELPGAKGKDVPTIQMNENDHQYLEDYSEFLYSHDIQSNTAPVTGLDVAASASCTVPSNEDIITCDQFLNSVAQPATAQSQYLDEISDLFFVSPPAVLETCSEYNENHDAYYLNDDNIDDYYEGIINDHEHDHDEAASSVVTLVNHDNLYIGREGYIPPKILEVSLVQDKKTLTLKPVSEGGQLKKTDKVTSITSKSSITEALSFIDHVHENAEELRICLDAILRQDGRAVKSINNLKDSAGRLKLELLNLRARLFA